MRSSPHPRGCSPPCWPVPDPRRVVPAPAGVFPSSSSTRRPALSRPRTRGGVPRAGRVGVSERGSSPHPRGCSRAEAIRLGQGGVVPAPAGVFPVVMDQGEGPSGRPRTRGGVPHAASTTIDGLPSSPHPRGCSPGAVVLGGAEMVVPAPAGVFPRDARCSTSHGRRPRTRGGVPLRGRRRETHVESSPHPRGCSPWPGPPRRRPHVVPAPAGVFPALAEYYGTILSRPRTRGGVPGQDPFAAADMRSSPHPRGCSQMASTLKRIDEVVPAPAGVFPLLPR